MSFRSTYFLRKGIHPKRNAHSDDGEQRTRPIRKCQHFFFYSICTNVFAYKTSINLVELSHGRHFQPGHIPLYKCRTNVHSYQRFQIYLHPPWK